MDQKLRTALLALPISLAVLASPALATQQARPALKGLVASMGGDPAAAGTAKYAYLRKLDSHLQQLAAGKAPSGQAPGAPTFGGLKLTAGGRVLVDVYVNGALEAAAGDLRALGMDVKAVARKAPERMVEGYLPVDAVTKAAALSATKAVVPVTASGTNTGLVLSQGDAPQHGPQARALGATGAGVTVGVMSDSINQVVQGGKPGLQFSQDNGDLPANVTVLNDGSGGEDEGRAMAEIVYDEAPGITDMLFDTGGGGPATKASHIAELVSNGAKVIVDDTFYIDEPMFQDGVIAQAVDAAKAAGIAYIAAGGNRARQSWEGTFVPGTGGDNDFGGGDIDQAIVTVPAHATLFGELDWDEPWGAATTDLDALLYVNGTVCNACSGEDDNLASGIPEESFGVVAGSSPINVSLRINRFAGSGTPKMKYILGSNFGTFRIADHDTGSDTIDPDAASANGSLTAAAVCWSTNSGNCLGSFGLQMPEAFSSRGPVVHTRDASGNPLSSPEVRQKPNVAGADGVSTDLPGGSGLNPFFGTSAAAPSVAGVAALALSAKPSLTVDQLYALLTNPADALDCTSAAGVPDTDCGAGFIQADRVVSAALDTTPPTITPTVSPATPDGLNGWYRSPVAVSWNVTEPQSFVTGSSGCGPSTVSTDTTGTTFRCSATSIGGSGASSVTIKRDGSPPAAPAISGISAKGYTPKTVPRSSALKCSSSDPTSGIASCVINGYSSASGSHTLTALATNGAGETSSSTLTYKVGCVVPKLKGKTLAAAKKALAKAGCKLGKTKPKRPSSRYRVKSSSPRAGAVKAINAKVSLTFKKKK